MAGKKSFVLYYDIREPLELLTNEQKGRLFTAILDYSEYGTVPDLGDASVSIAFAFIKASIDRDAEAWAAKCEKRAEAGSKGGKQRSANQANAKFAKQVKQSEANQAVNVPVNVNVPVPVPVNVPAAQDYAREAAPRAEESEKAAPDAQNVELSRVMTDYQDKVNPRPSTACTAELIEFSRLLGADLCCRAIDTACDENKRSWAYIRGILRGYQRDGVKTLADAQRREQAHDAQKQAARQKTASNLPLGMAAQPPGAYAAHKSDVDKLDRILAKKGANA